MMNEKCRSCMDVVTMIGMMVAADSPERRIGTMDNARKQIAKFNGCLCEFEVRSPGKGEKAKVYLPKKL